MSKNGLYLKPDSRNRVTLTKLTQKLFPLYRAYTQKDKIILEPICEISQEEAWLFAPENREILASVKRGLKQKATIKRGSFSKYLK